MDEIKNTNITEEFDTSDGKSDVFAAVALILLAIITLGGGYLLLGSDMMEVLRWHLALMALGLCVLPITSRIFKGFKSSVYLYSRLLGLFMVAYLQFLCSSLHILRFTAVNILIIFLTTTVVIYLTSIFISMKTDKKGFYADFIDNNLRTVAFEELIILFVFILVVWFLGFKIPGSQTERLMDFGFMKMMDNSDWLPAMDMWAAGDKINYYYFGQYLMTFLSKASFVPVEDAYSLAMDTIMTVCLVYVFKLTREITLHVKDAKKAFTWICPVISSVLVTLAGNFHYVVYYRFIPDIWRLFGLEGDVPSYWMADSTRYIGINPVNPEDQTIHEFPAYSFLIGDLHAHVIDIITVLLLLGVLLSIFMEYRNRDDSDVSAFRDLLNPNIIIAGFLIGISSMTNYWNYPIYFVVSGAVILAANLRRFKKLLHSLVVTLGQGVVILLIIHLVKFVFELNFVKMESGIVISKYHSALYQYLVLWGLPIALVTIWLVSVIVKTVEGESERRGLIKFLSVPDAGDVFVTILALCGIGLTIMPELIYVRDIYENGFPRANTMFKLTFEAFILLGICQGYISCRLLSEKPERTDDLRYINKFYFRKRLLIVLSVLLFGTCFYTLTASKQWVGSISTWTYQGLDSMKTVKADLGDEMLGIEWIDTNTPKDAVVVQAAGTSYSLYDVVSVLTGRPTIAGWQTHEWLWHNSYDYINDRNMEVQEIYVGTDFDLKKTIIEKYNVDYIFVGSKEYEKYGFINTEDLLKLGRIVYTDNGYEFPNFIIKIGE